MTGSPLKKFVLTPIILSTLVFSVLSLPLGILGNQPVKIQFEEEPIFQGRVRDIATPYLAIITALSLGTGIATVAMTGWRQSARQSTLTKKQLLQLEKSLQEKQKLLETFDLSDPLIDESELTSILADDPQPESLKIVTLELQPKPTQEIPSICPSTEQPAVQPLIITHQPLTAQPKPQLQRTVQTAVSKFASAQIFLGYNQAKMSIKPPPTQISNHPMDVQDLQGQIYTILTQINSLQTTLEKTTQKMGKYEVQGTESPPLQPVTWNQLWLVNPVAS